MEAESVKTSLLYVIIKAQRNEMKLPLKCFLLVGEELRLCDRQYTHSLFSAHTGHFIFL